MKSLVNNCGCYLSDSLMFGCLCVVVFLDGDGHIDTELWRTCAGLLVTVPRVGEKVFYFPQGHMEQVYQSSLTSKLI